MKIPFLTRVALLLPVAMSLLAQPYSANRTTVDGVPIIQLVHFERDTVVSIAPTVGNNAYEMLVSGKNVFWFPYKSVGEFAREPKLCGNPFLAPWANRLDEDGFYFEKLHYRLNEDLGNVRRDGNKLPIHGLLIFWPKWEVTTLEADSGEARVTSRLDIARYPELIGQFPFAHVIEMTYRLRDGALDVVTRIANNASRAMPVSVGFHPYFQIHDAPRKQWTVRLPVKNVWKLNDKLVPTGDMAPVEDLFPHPDKISLADTFLDNVFGGLVRESDGTARFSVQGKQQKIEVRYGPNYHTAVVYAPGGEGRDFICFEPMSGITNAFNLAHRGRYSDLQSIAPGAEWVETYSIHPSGF